MRALRWNGFQRARFQRFHLSICNPSQRTKSRFVAADFNRYGNQESMRQPRDYFYNGIDSTGLSFNGFAVGKHLTIRQQLPIYLAGGLLRSLRTISSVSQAPKFQIPFWVLLQLTPLLPVDSRDPRSAAS